MPSYHTARLSRRRERSWFTINAMVSVLLVAWLVVGFFRDPTAGFVERLAVCIGILAFSVPLILTVLLESPLPALDRTPRRAVVTGHTVAQDHSDESLDIPYNLVRVEVDLDGVTYTSHIADIFAEESIDRFVIGSTWSVYAFEGEQTKDSDPWFSRVVLTDDHDNVVRTRFSLTRVVSHHRPGTGSDLLLQRFEDSGEDTA